MRRRLVSFRAMQFAVFAAALALLLTWKADSVWAATQTVNIEVTYDQTEARAMLDMINQFRQNEGTSSGEQAWYWNPGDTQKLAVTGLTNLVYDYNLERVAMQRAAELAIAFSHTRPNGARGMYLDGEGSYSARGENIAAGQTSAEAAFISWREDSDPYNGQGHRRNMLGGYIESSGKSNLFHAIGIGHVIYGGRHFWVQEFRDRCADSTETAPTNGVVTVSVDLEDSQIVSVTPQVTPEEIILGEGESASLPVIKATIQTKESWISSTVTPALGTWTVADTSIASVQDGKVHAGAMGETVLRNTWHLKDDITTEIPVTVGDMYDMKNARIELGSASYTYTREAIQPAVTVKIGSKVLTKGNDYTLSYENNVNAGTASVTAVGTGDYHGKTSTTFEIKPRSLAGLWTSYYLTSVPYNGQEQTLAFPTYNSIALVKGTEYEIEYLMGNGIDVGTVQMRFRGIGNYTDTTNAGTFFQITPLDLSETTATLSDSVMTYTGESCEPAATVKVRYPDYFANVYRSSELPASDYSITYRDNVEPGQATAVISAKSANVTGSVEKTFKINKANRELKAPAAMEMTYGEGGGVAVIVSDSEGTLSYRSSDTSVLTVSSSGNIIPQKPGTANVIISKPETAHYLAAQTSVQVTVQPASIGETEPQEIPDQPYTGKEICPDLTLKLYGDRLQAGRDFTAEYTSNIDCGTASVRITGIGNYTGTRETSFKIVPREITKEMIEAPETASYTGEPQKPKMNVTVDGKALTEETDFEVSYEQNINAGMAAAIVRGIGNYTGTVSVPFEIQKAAQKISAENAVSMTYGDPETTLTAEASTPVHFSLSEEEKKILSLNETTGSVRAIGVGTAEVTVTAPGNDNYLDAEPVTVKVEVAPKTLRIDKAVAEDKTFDGTTDAVVTGSLEKGAILSGDDVTFTGTGSFADEHAGKKKEVVCSWTLDGEDVDKYQLESNSSTLEADIDPLDLTGKAEVTAKDLVYTGKVMQPELTVTAEIFGKQVALEGTAYQINSVVPEEVKEVGTYTVAVSYLGDYTGTGETSFKVRENQAVKAVAEKLEQLAKAAEDAVPEESAVKEAEDMLAALTEEEQAMIPQELLDKLEEAKSAVEAKKEEERRLEEARKAEEERQRAEKEKEQAEREKAEREKAEKENTGSGEAGSDTSGQKTEPNAEEAAQQKLDAEHPTGKGARKTAAEKAIFAKQDDKDLADSSFGLLQAKATKVTKKSIKVTWKKISGATHYVLYGNRCGKGRKYEAIKTLTKTSFTQKKLKKGTYYKYLVMALDANDHVVSVSKTIHVATSGGKVGNAKKITTKAKKNKVSIKVKKTFKLKAKQVAASKKLKIKKHRGIAYETDHPEIATVSSKGVIKGIKKGTCYVYAYAQNGVCAKIKVTVK